MIQKIIKYIFGMELAGILLIVLAFAMGLATFIENDFGTSGSKALVYNALWFELVIGLLFVNLLNNAIKMKPWKTGKWVIFTFHMSFILIIIGASVTRYIGYEGIMSIREGVESNTYYSDKTYIIISDENNKEINKKAVRFSGVSNDEVSLSFEVSENEYYLETSNFIPNAIENIAETDDGNPMFEITIRTNGNFRSYSVESGESINIDGHSFGFNVDEKMDINMTSYSDEVLLSLSDTGQFFDMMSGIKEVLIPDSLYKIHMEKLYSFQDFSWVYKHYYPKASLVVSSSNSKQNSGIDAIHYKIFDSNDQLIEKAYALGSSGYSLPVTTKIDNKEISIAYGSLTKVLPFSIKLRDFQLERYPASNSPSSYASEVTLIDESENLNMDYRIYMNHVLDHRGYRFFQSSYDPDELGTVLSVNHDFWGMIITYIGYGLMMLGMFLALFAKKTRFRYLMKKTTVASIIVGGLFFLFPLISQSQTRLVDNIPQQQIDELSSLLVQGHSGRIQPYNSISNQVVRKFSRRTSYDGVNSDRMLLGMMMNPEYWVKQPLIKVSNDELKKIIGNDASRANFTDFFKTTPQGNEYKLSKYIDEAYMKKPAERGKFDKDIITVDERVNVFYLAITKDFLQIYPIPNQPNMEWKNPQGPFQYFHAEDSAFVSSAFDYYLESMYFGVEQGDYSKANLVLGGIKQYQDNYFPQNKELLNKLDQEILYNKVDIFNRLYGPYGILGFVMLILLFIRVLKPKYEMKWTIHILAIFIFLAFIAHTFGLIARWYIAGHAPWSNGFESMIFIGWSTILAGLIFYRNSPIALASTSVLTFLIMYVAHLSWMNPEITNLVPVLKSYWLTIHVAIITSSYGFLFLGAFMGYLNLIFFIFQSQENTGRIKAKIEEISRINEMTIIIGLYLLTIGTFLGGIWANESWGRYWGWDPKETWALVTILVYAFIVHMRFIPGLRGAFAFNFMSVVGYFSVLMTYFGVNYYLSGLHSYASGDPMPIPDFVYYTIGIIAIVAIAAYWKYRKYWLTK